MSDLTSVRMAALNKAVRDLGEHFDAVQIVASYPTGDRNQFSGMCTDGGGNFFARVSMCQKFVRRYEDLELADTIAERIGPPPDDSENWKAKR